MPRFWRGEYSEGEDYDLEWNLREKYSSRGLSPLGRGRRRLIRDLFGDSDDEDDRGRYRHSRPSGPPGTEIVVAAKAPTPVECKYKCCPCHAEKLAAAQACHTVHNTVCCASKAPAKPEEPRIVVDVEDRTGGPMAQRHGSRFPISIKPKATIDDIISTLTPDRHRHKVVVKWEDGYCGDLETVTKVEDLRHYARRLVITKRKQVRYGRQSAH